MKDKVQKIYEEFLPHLDVKPTPQNVNCLNAIYTFLREIYQGLEEKENGGNEDGQTVDLSGRDND